MKLLQKFQDDRYLVVKALYGGEIFIYIDDRAQKTQALGRLKEDVDLKPFWEKHVKGEKGFCLPCHLLLLPTHKVLVGESSTAELGLTLERFKEFKNRLKEVL